MNREDAQRCMAGEDDVKLQYIEAFRPSPDDNDLRLAPSPKYAGTYGRRHPHPGDYPSFEKAYNVWKDYPGRAWVFRMRSPQWRVFICVDPHRSWASDNREIEFLFVGSVAEAFPIFEAHARMLQCQYQS